MFWGAKGGLGGFWGGVWGVFWGVFLGGMTFLEGFGGFLGVGCKIGRKIGSFF